MSNAILLAARMSLVATVAVLGATVALGASVPTEQTAIVQRGFGGPEVLKLETIPVLEPGEGQVLVQVYAAGVNPVDWKAREGINGRRIGTPPPAGRPPALRIPGSDIAGVVAKVGPGVTDLKVGDPVAGSSGGGGAGLNGSYSHYALAMANRLIPKPKNLSYAEAAGLATAASTPAVAMHRLKIQPGQTLLITGVAGGVGSAMAQLAKVRGARVIGTASARHNAFLKTIGVDEVIDYTKGDWASTVQNVDAVFDTVGGVDGAKALGTLKKGGQFIGIANENGEPAEEQCAAAGVTCVPLRRGQPGDPTERDLLNEVGRLANEGKLKVKVERIFPLEQAGAAQELSREGHTEGKIILVAVPDPAVTVTGGRVQGKLLPAPDGAVFKGIPFAQPPVGGLRWREPQPLKSWTGVRQAAEFGPACPQSDSGWNKLAAEKSSEDCLYLNVWAPEWPAKAPKPVMVWVHGGGNTGGSAMGAGGIEPPFDAASLARHGVVVVTLNYRLGLFGFVGHPELTAESPHHASGGYGLLDQVAALQWVHDNIARFGGDPGNVTLFGQSAGAQNTTILVASKLTKGLIHKAIAESGTPMIGDKRLQSPAQTEQLGVILAGALKAPARGAIQYLRGLPAAQILAAMPDFRKGLGEQKLILDVGMDGYAVAEFSPAVYRSGREAPIPMIIGSNGRDSPGYRPMGSTPEEIRAAMATRIGALYGSYPDLAGQVSKAYAVGGGGNEAPTNAAYGPPDLQLAVDHGFRCEAVALAKWHSAVAPTWQYEFTAGTAAHPPAHSAELDFVFGYLRDQASDAQLVKLSADMQQYWTNFAKTGDPNGPGLPRWAKYQAAARSYLDFGNEGPLLKADLRSPVCPLYVEKLTRDIAARH